VSHPRRIVPDETYLVTRRCPQRAFRLHPNAKTKDIFLYCLAYAAWRTGVRIHAVCVMSNHHHMVVSDPKGVLPNFLRDLHRLCAKALNALQSQWENLWAAEPCNVVRLATAEDIEDKIAYVVANPVAAGLVRKPTEWPGINLWGDKKLRVSRPTSYFGERGVCPKELSLHIESSPVGTESAVEWRTRVRRTIAAKAQAAREAVAAKGRSFLGRTAVRASSFLQRAKSEENHFDTIPTFAAVAREVRRALSALERGFRATYRRALKQWRSGERTVVFPRGTWAMGIFHSALVESHSPPDG
jgi:REP element-mobilizing transposase RayT